MSDKAPAPVKPADRTLDAPAGRDARAPRHRESGGVTDEPAKVATPKAASGLPLVTHLAPPHNRSTVGQTVIPRGRNISWKGGPVEVYSDGSEDPAPVQLQAMEPNKRGPNVYALSPALVAQLVRTGAARVATLKKTLDAKTADALDADDAKARLDRARAARAAGGPPDGSPERQTKPEERRYGRQIFTILPPRQLEANR